jgi:hypothetical protein
MESNGFIKMTIKSRILLAIDKFLRSLYPQRLNHWLFDHMDKDTRPLSVIQEEQRKKYARR